MRSKANETTAKSTKLIDIPPLITVWLQARVPRLQKFFAAIALSRGEEIGKRKPLLSFALVSNCTTHFRPPFCFGTANCIMWGMIHIFRCALYWPLHQATPWRRVRLSPASESQVQDK